MDGGVLPRAILVHIVVSLLTNSETAVFGLRFSSGGCSPTRPWGYLIFLSLNVAPFIIMIYCQILRIAHNWMEDKLIWFSLEVVLYVFLIIFWFLRCLRCFSQVRAHYIVDSTRSMYYHILINFCYLKIRSNMFQFERPIQV